MVIRARATLLLRRFAVRAIEFSCAVDGPTIDTCENDGIELATVRARGISPPPARSADPRGSTGGPLPSFYRRAVVRETDAPTI